MKKTYTLSELCDQISDCLKSEFPDTYLVTAEISNLQYKGGHCYLELIEKGKNVSLYSAKIRAVCWSSTYSMLSAYFLQETGQTLQNGMKVLLEVEINFHNVYGLSLIIVGIDPQYTLGDLKKQRDITIQQLKDEGIFDMNKMLDLPSLPQRIAIISSSDAAGYEDFCNQLINNQQGYAFKIELFPAIMQGVNAVPSICAALSAIAQDLQQYDAVVITRGGGSSNDLTCFDDYLLCSYCAQFPLPIITAIGHTKDVSVVDQVAFMSLKTPTAAAAFLIETLDNQNAIIADLEYRMKITLKNVTALKRQQLENLKSRIISAFHLLLSRQSNNLDLIAHTIELHSPQKILNQGYSITFVDGKPLKSVAEVKSGMLVTTEVKDGVIKSIVQ